MIETSSIDKVIQVIEKYDLKNPCRKHQYIYPRYFVYFYLRKLKFPLHRIGRILEKDHATVIHGVKMHKMYTKNKDQVYLSYIADIKNELGDIKGIPNLRKDVLKCDTMEKLSKIKKRIQENYY